jgi:hypothetical protein
LKLTPFHKCKVVIKQALKLTLGAAAPLASSATCLSSIRMLHQNIRFYYDKDSKKDSQRMFKTTGIRLKNNLENKKWMNE